MEAKASGISSFEALILDCFATPMTGGTNMAVTVVLFMKAETKLTTLIIARSKRLLLPLAILCRRIPMASITPVRCSAPLMTKIDASITMMSLLKPAKASSGFKMPVSDERDQKQQSDYVDRYLLHREQNDGGDQ